MVVAWKIERALRCPDCNTYYEEYAPELGGHVHAYFPKATYCLGCKAKQDKYDAVRENSKDDNSATSGLQIQLEKNPASPNLHSPLTKRPIIQR